MSSAMHTEPKRGMPRKNTPSKVEYGLEHFLQRRDGKKHRAFIFTFNRMIRDTFDWKHRTARGQSKSNWNKFWKKIKSNYPTFLSPDIKSAVVNQVRNHISQIRCTHRHEFQREICTTSTAVMHTHSHFLADKKSTNNTMIVISDEDLPRFRRPDTCLVPLPLPKEPQTYEIAIVPTSDLPLVTVPTRLQTISYHKHNASSRLITQASVPWDQSHRLQLSARVPTPTPQAGASHPTQSHQPKFLYHAPSPEIQAWNSPDVHKFLSTCVPPMTHLLERFVDDLKIRDLKCLLTLKRWPPQTLRKYFLNLTRRKKLTGIESEVVKKGLQYL